MLLPAALTALGGKPAAAEPHRLDFAFDESSGAVRNILDIAAMLVLAAALFCTAFLPAMRFGERPAATVGGPFLATPDARGAVHFILPQSEVENALRLLSELPEVGAIRTAAQFMPPDAGAKIVELRRLAALNSFAPADPTIQEVGELRESFAQLEQQLTLIAGNLSASRQLRDAALRMRRAVSLFVNAAPLTPDRAAALDNALFGRLANSPKGWSAWRGLPSRGPRISTRACARVSSPLTASGGSR